ncbi:MAG: hypothetical protein FWD61_08720 [Phycisphaerales bacterium]|nr:hypothetical protein [Phycisphaerales bacterium]
MKTTTMVNWLSGATLLLTVGLVLAQEAAKVPFAIGKETTVISEPLHEDGTPDYIAALNEQLSKGIMPENNAFVAWLEVAGTDTLPEKTREQVLKMCGAREDLPTQSQLTTYASMLKRHGEAAATAWDDVSKATRQLWEAKDFPVVAEWLKENDSAMDKAKQAFSRSKYWTPYVAGDGRTMLTMSFPSFAAMKFAADGLCARATLRAKAGDFNGFMSDVIGAKRIARRISRWTLIENLVGTAINAAASRSIGAVAGSGILSAKQCDELQKAIDALEPLPQPWESIDVYERWGDLDTLVLLATGKGESAIKSLIPNLLFDMSPLLDIDRTWVDWNAVLKGVNHFLDTQISIMKKPDLEEVIRELQSLETKVAAKVTDGWAKRRGGGDTQDAYTQRVGDGITKTLFLGVLPSRIMELYQRGIMEQEMAKAMVAAGRYRAEKGKWPGSLEELTPQYLKEVPTDIYSGKNVLYARGEKGIRIYSVGPNRHDDGGIKGVMKDGKQAGNIVIGVEEEAGSQKK